ncbi:hypothetical protein CBR_g41452 [Chara braunii]|uniref:Uncharacterized protein n=1 Tax=Chara braunii TaxID=69332 RepID=A0A388LVU7_CHABU|nr:hypothetical protein CBR_g41452 [Chara braunii]|eukprot:GBG86457.1 hypothetical protein CBR_g41452 [Chara braunii]
MLCRFMSEVRREGGRFEVRREGGPPARPPVQCLAQLGGVAGTEGIRNWLCSFIGKSIPVPKERCCKWLNASVHYM